MPGLEAAFDRIGEAVEAQLPQSHAPGLALAVTDREDVLGVVVRGFADVASQKPVRPETRFEIGSISKQFASICLLQEVEAGRVALEDRVNDVVPWLDLPEPFGPITLHHLLTHSAGLAIGPEESPTGPGAIAIARRREPTFAPGSHFSYSNDGYKLVGAVLECLTGEPAWRLLHERILEPLGMRASESRITNETRLDLAVGYEPVFDDRPPHTEHPLAPAIWLVTESADGSIVSTVGDMCSYARMLLGRGAATVEGHEVRILPEATFEQLIAPRIDVSDPPGMRYGYGVDVWERHGRPMIGHSGGMVGFTALLWVDRESGLACVALQNGGGDKEPAVAYALDAVRAALAGGAPPPPPAQDLRAVPDGTPVQGRFRSLQDDEHEIELVAAQGRLRLLDGSLVVDLERWPGVADAFCVPDPAWDRFLLRVIRDDSGAVAELVHGPARFVPPDRPVPERRPLPEAWRAFPGEYRSNTPWAPVLVVFERAGELWALTPSEGVEERLVPLEDDEFALGEAWKPPRLHFEEIVEASPSQTSSRDLATVAVLDGGRWYRSSMLG